jgi:hypothetical protein
MGYTWLISKQKQEDNYKMLSKRKIKHFINFKRTELLKIILYDKYIYFGIVYNNN